MTQSSSLAASAPLRADAPETAPAEYRTADFLGCESFHLPAREVERYEGRLEFWDGRTETAWKVCEPTSIQHEQPSRRLVELVTRVAALRGSRIADRVLRLVGPCAPGGDGPQALADAGR